MLNTTEPDVVVATKYVYVQITLTTIVYNNSRQRSVGR